jgi:hypothetical protein
MSNASFAILGLLTVVSISAIVVGSVAYVNAGKVPNSATTATSENIANTIVARDASGNFVTNNVTLSGLSTGVLHSNASGVLSSSSVVGSDIAANTIPDSCLETISTTGKVANSATTATSSGTANAIVARDSFGNFSAGTITADLNGNATTANTATNANTANNFSGSLNGDVKGTQSTTQVVFVSGQTASNVAAGTILANAATSANTFSAIVRRDASGNFNASKISASNGILLDNNKAYSIKDAGGIEKSILDCDNSNTVKLRGAGGSMYINPDASGNNTLIGFNNPNNTDIYHGSALNLRSDITGIVIGESTATRGLTLNNSTANYIPAVLNYYEEFSTTVTFSGATTLSGIALSLTRIGRMVNMILDGGSNTASTAASLSAAGAIPARFRPAFPVTAIIQVTNNGNLVVGSIEINTDGLGIIIVNGSAANTGFLSTGLCGFSPSQLSWQTA